MIRKKVLMACSNYWTFPLQLGNNHFAHQFIKSGWDVAWISDPITPLHLIGGKIAELKERYYIYKDGGRCDLDDRLWHYVPMSLVSPNNQPILNQSWVHDKWQKLTIPNIIQKIKDNGFGKVDLLFLNSIAQAFWLDAVQYQRSVLRIADKYSGLSKYTTKMSELEKWMAQNVDLVCYSGVSLEEYVKKLKPKSSLYLPNGVNFHHFAERSWEIPLEYSSIPRPIAVYAGAIESWFDYELIKIVAASLPKVSFVIIGPDSHGLAQHNLEPFNNIYLIGEKPYEYLPSYMKYADIGLIPFNVQDHCELISHVNPLKLYEYMASGLPVVSTDWLELRKLESPAVLCKTPHDFIKGVKQTLEKPFNKKDLVEFAKNHDWSHQFKLLSDSLERI